MKAQALKPITFEALRTLPANHQYNNFVRVNGDDALYHFNQGRRILLLVKTQAYWLETKEELTNHGKKFVFF
jgi:hypothetical protein